MKESRNNLNKMRISDFHVTGIVPLKSSHRTRLENPEVHVKNIERSVHISFYIDETNKSYYIWRLKIIDPKNRGREDETGPMWSKFLVPKLDPDTFASSNISKSTA